MANNIPQVKPGKADIKISKKARDAAKKMMAATSFAKKNLEKDELLQVNHVRELMPIIDVLFQLEPHSPTKLAETTQTLVDAGMKIKYRDPLDPMSIKAMHQAYVTRVGRAKYEIFINGLCEEEAFEEMDLHEKGHVLYQHTDGVRFYLKIFEQQLNRIWSEKIVKWFTPDVLKSVKREKIVKFLFTQFSNIAQDMEINSKLFEDEWIAAKKLMSRSGLIMYHKNLMDEFDDLSGLIKNDKARKIESKQYAQLIAKFNFLVRNINCRIDGTVDDFQYCHPAQKGWAVKLDWMTYMTLLVKDADETMKQISQMISQMFGKGQQAQGQSEGDGSEGDGDAQGNGNSNNSGGSGKPISKDVLDDYFNSEDAKDEAEANAASGGDEAGDDEDETEGGSGSFGPSPGGRGRTKSGTGNWQSEVSTCDTFESFTKLLAKLCMGKKMARLNSDVMYYSNRRKISSGVVVPRRHLIEKYMPEACTIVVDISGSVSTSYVERVINAIVDCNAGIDLKNSRIIFCDTQIVADEVLSKKTNVRSGGGTDIAVGIRYVFDKKYVKKPTDKLFIISDLEDSLTNWLDVAKNKPGQKYVIGYNVHDSDNFDGKKVMENYVNNNEKAAEFCKTFKVMFINERIHED